jgi:hypothetical protein
MTDTLILQTGRSAPIVTLSPDATISAGLDASAQPRVGFDNLSFNERDQAGESASRLVVQPATSPVQVLRLAGF